MSSIPGYDFASETIPRSPVSLEELRHMEQACGYDDETRDWLRQAGRVLIPRAEELVNLWRARIGAHPEMVRAFFGPDGTPDERYKRAVKKRFVQWVKDVCEREHDQAWLDYQDEIGKRHTPEKKNRMDNAQTAPVVPLRYLIAFSAIVATSVRPFFVEAGFPEGDAQQMQDAWTKSVLLHLTLWSRPYTVAGLW